MSKIYECILEKILWHREKGTRPKNLKHLLREINYAERAYKSLIEKIDHRSAKSLKSALESIGIYDAYIEKAYLQKLIFARCRTASEVDHGEVSPSTIKLRKKPELLDIAREMSVI